MKRQLTLVVAILALLPIFASCDKTEEKPVEKATISVSPTSAQFVSDGGSVNIAVTTNQDTFTYSGEASWLTVAKDGNSLSLTASANTETAIRNCTITLEAGDAQATIEVSQDAGSKYPGYDEMTDVEASYFGTMMSKFYEMPDADGGYAEIHLSNGTDSLAIQMFTELYQTEEEVVLTEGQYNPDNSFGPEIYKGKKMTYVKGMSQIIDDDEELYFGTMAIKTVGDVENRAYIVDGTFTITKNTDGTFLIKTDFKDEEGNDYKFFYEGEIDYDKSEATYPGGEEKPDPTQIVSAELLYLGDQYEAGTTTLCLYLYCEDYSPVTCIEYNVPTIEFEDLTDLTGEFITPEGDNDYTAGTVNKGSLIDLGEGMVFPMSTFIMFTFGDYFVADSFASLVLEKNENGNYSISSALMGSEGDMYMYMIDDMEITISDGRDSGDEEDE